MAENMRDKALEALEYIKGYHGTDDRFTARCDVVLEYIRLCEDVLGDYMTVYGNKLAGVPEDKLNTELNTLPNGLVSDETEFAHVKVPASVEELNTLQAMLSGMVGELRIDVGFNPPSEHSIDKPYEPPSEQDVNMVDLNVETEFGEIVTVGKVAKDQVDTKRTKKPGRPKKI